MSPRDTVLCWSRPTNPHWYDRSRQAQEGSLFGMFSRQWMNLLNSVAETRGALELGDTCKVLLSMVLLCLPLGYQVPADRRHLVSFIWTVSCEPNLLSVCVFVCLSACTLWRVSVVCVCVCVQMLGCVCSALLASVYLCRCFYNLQHKYSCSMILVLQGTCSVQLFLFSCLLFN